MFAPAAAGRRGTDRNRRRAVGRGLLLVAAIMVLADCSRTDDPEISSWQNGTDQMVTTEDAGPTDRSSQTAGSPPGSQDSSDMSDSADPGDGQDPGSDGNEARHDGAETVRPEEAVAVFAEAVGADLVLAEAGPERILVWHNGSLTEQQTTDTEQVWSDGTFIYRRIDEGGGTLSATATTPDGTVVCETGGPMHHVTKRADGSHVAAVEEQEKLIEFNPSGETPVPLYAVDCATGERTPIDPVFFYRQEIGGRGIERVRGREFTLLFDVEGNSQIFNEAGIELNGDDYSGYERFSPDAKVVVYGDMGAGAGPHYSPVLVARDTTSGQQLWRVDLGTVFKTFDFVGDRLVVQVPDDATALISGEATGTTALILDAATGRQLDQVELPFETLFVG